jgi:serine/threonine protein kinase
VKVCPNCQSRFDQGEAFCPDDGTELVEAEELSPGRLAGRTLDETVEVESLRRTDDLGERYRGELVETETPVDVTVFNQAANPVRERLDELAPTAAILENALPPQILAVHSVELDADERYLVEQSAHGEPLRELIDQEAPMDWRQAVRLTARLAQALHWMAERGHIHRGVHPGAIHVDTDEDAIQVGDWMQSALTRHANPLEGAQNGAAFVGFPAYMAPEALEEDGDVDERSLVYSLGMLLYEMILGRPPFTAEETTELIKRQLHEKPLELGVASDDEDLHPELDSILGMTWSKDPEERFQTPKAIVAALSSLVDDSPRELAPAPEVADDPIFETGIDLPDLDEDESDDESDGDLDEEIQADGGEEVSDSDTLIGISATDVPDAESDEDSEETDESGHADGDSADDESDDDIQTGEAAIGEDDSERERKSSADQPSIIIEDPELRSAMEEESSAETADEESDGEETAGEADADDDGDGDETPEDSGVSSDIEETEDLEDEDSDVEAPADSDEENVDTDEPETGAEPAGGNEAAERDGDTNDERDQQSDEEDSELEENDSEETETTDDGPSFVTVEAETASAALLKRTQTPSGLLALGIAESTIDDSFAPDFDTPTIAAESTHLLREDDSDVEDESAAWDELSDEIDGDDGESDEEPSVEDEEAEQQAADETDDEESDDGDDAEAESDRESPETDAEDQAEDGAEDVEDGGEAADPDEEGADEQAEDDESDIDDEADEDEEQASEEDQDTADEDEEVDEDEPTAEDEEDAEADDDEADTDDEVDEEDDEDEESSVDASGETVVVSSDDDETETDDDEAETDEEAEADTDDDEAETDEETDTDDEDEESSVEASGEAVVASSDDEAATDDDETDTDDETESDDDAGTDEDEAPQLSSFEANGAPETDATDEWFEVDEEEAWRAADVREGRDRSEIIRKYATTAVWVVLILAAVGLLVFAQTYEPADGQQGDTETQTSSE